MGLCTVSFDVVDFTGHKRRRLSGPRDAAMQEAIDSILPEMDLPANDLEGRPITYAATRERDQERLLPSDRIADVLTEGDVVVLTQNVTAG